MEELFSLGILILVLIVNAISALAKSKKQEDAETQRKAAAAARIKAAQQKMAAEARHQAATPAEPSPAIPQPMQVIQPTVHAHVKPDCAEHDAPAAGSLDYISTEGKDPCHEDELTLARQPAEAPVPAAPGLTFDWSGENLVKAFVMQEVLQRPGARNRR